MAGAPIAGATVTFIDTLGVVRENVGRRATTNGAGVYTFENVTLGNVNLEVAAAGYQDRRAGMNLSAASTSFDMQLRRLQQPITITGAIGGPQPWACTVTFPPSPRPTPPYPCQEYQLTLRRAGSVNATLTWPAGTGLSLVFITAFEQGRVTSASGTLTTRAQFFGTSLNYTVRVDQPSPQSQPVPFTLTLDVVD